MRHLISSRFGKTNQVDVNNILRKNEENRMKNLFFIIFFQKPIWTPSWLRRNRSWARFNAWMRDPISSRFGKTNPIDVNNILRKKDENRMETFF